MFDDRLTRVDAQTLRVNHPSQIPISLFANQRVPIERQALDELWQMLELVETLERWHGVAPDDFARQPQITRVALTPDFHKAQGVPVGTVVQTNGFYVPQAIGGDINCGMRLHVTALNAEQLEGKKDALEMALRRRFFEGGRDIAMTGLQRQALLQGGLEGLANAVPASQQQGLWRAWHEQAGSLERTMNRGSLIARNVAGLEDFIGNLHALSRDAQIGSIGGGNHFVEIQRVSRILEPVTAHAWGLKLGAVVVMVHSGSLSIGQRCGALIKRLVRDAYPTTLKHPANGLYPLPLGEAHQSTLQTVRDALHAAANFAFANRLFLALMARDALEAVVSETGFELLYDAPHNFCWLDGETALHRKGATPSRGYSEMQDTPFAYHGEPVLVPGSMGAASCVLAGSGRADALWSASHGAGRLRSRGTAMRVDDSEFEAFMERFTVVTPLDLRDPHVKSRPDIVIDKLLELKQEAPFAYKDIAPVIDTLTGAGMARGVAMLEPLLTVKG